MATGATFNRNGSHQAYETPPELIAAVERRFGKLEFDLAASDENAKAGSFFNEVCNALSDRQQWPTDKLSWCNPPFANIAPWADKCSASAKLGARILLLVPASVGSNWFARSVHRQAMVFALSPRIKFVGADDPYPKDIILAAYGFGVGFDCWDWRAAQ